MNFNIFNNNLFVYNKNRLKNFLNINEYKQIKIK